MDYIDLSFNSITSADDFFVRDMQHVSDIDIGYNPLSTFPDQNIDKRFHFCVRNVFRRKKLWPENYCLTKISDKAFELAKRQRFLDLLIQQFHRISSAAITRSTVRSQTACEFHSLFLSNELPERHSKRRTI